MGFGEISHYSNSYKKWSLALPIIARSSVVLDHLEKIIISSAWVGSIVLPITVLGFRGNLLSWEIALSGLVIVHGLCAVAIFCGLLSFVPAIKGDRSPTGESRVLMVLCSAPIAASLYLVGLNGLGAALINDISTDTTNPPSYKSASLMRANNQNSTSYPRGGYGARQLQHYPDITSSYLDVSAQVAYRAARYTVFLQGWQVMIADRSQGRIEAVSKTLMMGFEDDIVIRIRPLGSQRSVLDMRSSSREGTGDLGANAKRIREYLSKFQSVLIKQQNDLKYRAVRVDTVPAAT